MFMVRVQIRSHAQKYFLKVQKNGTGEHVPPPRPKRKSAQPYPQKAPKCGTLDEHGGCGEWLKAMWSEGWDVRVRGVCSFGSRRGLVRGEVF